MTSLADSSCLPLTETAHTISSNSSGNGNGNGNRFDSGSERDLPIPKNGNMFFRHKNVLDPHWGQVMGLANNVDGRTADRRAVGEGIMDVGQPDSRSQTGDLGLTRTKESSDKIQGLSEGIIKTEGSSLQGVDNTRHENTLLKREIEVLKSRHLHDELKKGRNEKSRIEERQTGVDVSYGP